MTYNFKNGYAAIHTEETVAKLNDYKRDGKMTVVHHDLTGQQVKAVRAEIEKQGNKLW